MRNYERVEFKSKWQKLGTMGVVMIIGSIIMIIYLLTVPFEILIIQIWIPIMFLIVSIPALYYTLISKRLIIDKNGITYWKANKKEFEALWSEIIKIHYEAKYGGGSLYGGYTNKLEIKSKKNKLLFIQEEEYDKVTLNNIFNKLVEMKKYNRYMKIINKNIDPSTGIRISKIIYKDQ